MWRNLRDLRRQTFAPNLRPCPTLSSKPPPHPRPGARTVFCTAPGFGLLSFAGPDAESFLQGQLSNDIKALAPGALQLSSYNSPKGRMLATLLVWRDGADAFRALVAADLAETLRKRLAMFVLRAKVIVADLSAGHALIGLGGTGCARRSPRGAGRRARRRPCPRRRRGDSVALPDGRIVVVAALGHIAESLRTRLAQEAIEAPPRMPGAGSGFAPASR